MDSDNIILFILIGNLSFGFYYYVHKSKNISLMFYASVFQSVVCVTLGVWDEFGEGMDS